MIVVAVVVTGLNVLFLAFNVRAALVNHRDEKRNVAIGRTLRRVIEELGRERFMLARQVAQANARADAAERAATVRFAN